MSGRADILARIRAAVDGADQVDLPDAPADPFANVPAATAIDTFCDRIRAYRATIERVPAADIADAVTRACASITSPACCHRPACPRTGALRLRLPAYGPSPTPPT